MRGFGRFCVIKCPDSLFKGMTDYQDAIIVHKFIYISLILSIFLLPCVVLAYQSPGSPAGFVNDFAGILSPEVKTQLEAKLTDFAGKESNEISVVAIKSLDGDAIENFAVKLFEEWKIGKTKQDNGVLLLVAPNDRQVRIEVGYGLEGALTDLESKMIIENVLTPAFKAGDYNSGVSRAVEAIMVATKGEYLPSEKTSQMNLKSSIYFGGFIFLMILEIISFFLRRAAKSKSIWPGALGGGIMGLIIGFIASVGVLTIGFLIGGALLGLLIDYVLSHTKAGDGFRNGKGGGGFFMGGFGGGGGGGFGGFGGGSSGGGGAGGRW